MSGLKLTRQDPARVLPALLEVPGTFDGDNADWDTGGVPDGGAADQWKQPVRVATTATITIATALNAGDTIDGVTLAAGDRVLVKNQSAPEENGIYVVSASPERAGDMDSDDEVLGAVVYVIAGTANEGTTWAVMNTTATVVDTDAIDWAAGGGGGSALEVLDEGVSLDTAVTSIDFVGAGVVATNVLHAVTVTLSEPNADAHIADASDAHDASAVSIVDSPNNFSATDVEGALEELASGAIITAIPPAIRSGALLNAYGSLR